MKHYRIYDHHTKYFVGGIYTTFKRALSKADKLDNIFGGYRYSVKTIIEENK